MMTAFFNEATLDSQWRAMLSAAKAYFDTNCQKKCRFHQCIVLSAGNGEQTMIHINADSIDTLKDQVGSNVASLSKKQDPVTVKRMICMWDNGAIDVPSSEFINRLCAPNSENKNAVILLRAGTDAYLTKQLTDII